MENNYKKRQVINVGKGKKKVFIPIPDEKEETPIPQELTDTPKVSPILFHQNPQQPEDDIEYELEINNASSDIFGIMGFQELQLSDNDVESTHTEDNTDKH